MPVKLLVLYPHPTDRVAFERKYRAEHLPFMRELLGPGVPLLTYITFGTEERPAPYYRVAEIHFSDVQHFDEFVLSGKSKIGRDSSVAVSTGGKPMFLVCEEQAPI